MLNRDRPRQLNHKHRAFSNPLLRPVQRLIFPSKELEEGYIGKKHFVEKNNDNVLL